MALLADGWHMSSHVLAIGLTWFAYGFARRHRANPHFTLGTDKVLGFAQVVEAALVDSGTLTVKGVWSTPKETQGGKFRGAAVGSTAGFSYAAQVVEVSVDEDTGVVRVERVWVAHDCGFAINPLAVEGQVQGAVWMGMGQALGEETQYHEGLPMRPNMLDYRIPTIVESPPIDVHLVESLDPLGPFGAKEASEGALHGFPPALTNAICDAIGIRLAELPATPDRVLEAIQLRRREQRLQARRAFLFNDTATTETEAK